MRRRSLGVALTVAALAFGLSAPQTTNSASAQSLEQQRDQVRAERARVAAQIDTSKASLNEIDDALQLIEENLRTQEAALSRIEGEVAQAESDIKSAEAAIVRLDKEIGILRDEMRRRAVAAYVSPASDDVLSVLQTNDFTPAATRKFYIELRSQGDADVSDRLEGATDDIGHQRELAKEAREIAEAKRVEQAERTAAVDAARADQQRLSDAMQETIDSQIARSLDLAATDRELSAKIAEQQAALAARLAAEKAAREEAARRRAQSSGGRGAPLPPLSGGGGSSSGNGGVAVCSVPNISGGVNCQIKDRVTNMINAARADGVNLTGSGYRDASRQIQLRQSHCGSSYYAIYQMSASSCRPPTAKPGSSQHEIGLAIDFSNCGRGSASFAWLKANAASHGFYNLPSESWHWSTSGR